MNSFEENVRKIKQKDFSIISNNCLGSRLYQVLKIPYLTPTVGLFFFAPDYISFCYNLRESLAEELNFKKKSKYNFLNLGNEKINYPIGSIKIQKLEIEIHFLHYSDEEECYKKWKERSNRINWERLFYIFTDNNFFYEKLFQLFSEFPSDNKVLFTAHKFNSDIATQIEEYRDQCTVGNLYSDYEILANYFDFAKWINGYKQ